MKRILYLIKGLGRGGAEQSILNAARYHDTSRFHYEAAYLVPGIDTLVPELEARGVRVHCLGGAGVGWVGRLRSLIRERKIDLVHAHSPYAAVGARIGLRIGRGSRTPIVYSEQNVWDAYRPATRWANMLTFSLNAHVFAVSGHVRSSMRHPSWLPLPMPPVSVLHHGLDWEAVPTSNGADGLRARLGLPPDAPVVGTVATFKPAKGHQYLIEAAAIVHRTIPNVRFVLVGQGPLEGELRARVATLGLEETVLFRDLQGPAWSVVEAFDVFALPSLHEGLSVAALEAMALSRPMVVSAIGPLLELMGDPPAGVTVPVGDTNALAAAITDVLGNSARARFLGEAALTRARAFDVRVVVERAEAVYEELASR